MSHTLLNELRQFVIDELTASQHQLFEGWDRPLNEKLLSGHTQAFTHLEEGIEHNSVWAYLDPACESRFREGDMVCLHTGDPHDRFLKQLILDEEQENRWLLTGMSIPLASWQPHAHRKVYADTDMLDLSGMFAKAISEVAETAIGRQLILPLLNGDIAADTLNTTDYDYAAEQAESPTHHCNDDQVEAVGWACGATHMACIQGPPGTGKTRVLALIAKILVDRGERVLVTSHTHMAINNALNKIHDHDVPVIKVGRTTATKGLRTEVENFERIDEWEERPSHGGYVIGATPFATCTPRLETCQFNTVIFDEASQITMPLAVMAMRKATRFIFIGDHKQLPPVVTSRSVLDPESPSVFAKLMDEKRENVVSLYSTYRMNKTLTSWPSELFYDRQLTSCGDNAQRQFSLAQLPKQYSQILSRDHSLVFVESRQSGARTSNTADATLVAELCSEAIDAGLDASEIGIVAPFRNQGRRIRALLNQKLEVYTAKSIIADTVERMQGQEREMIILCMTTTDPHFLQLMAPFLFQPERLNVSVTRAMTKTIIIGPVIDQYFSHDEAIVHQWAKDYQALVERCYKAEI